MINSEIKPKKMLIQPRRMSEEEFHQLEMDFARCAGFVKMATGVANNAALAVMRHALSVIKDQRDSDTYKERPYRPHPGYRHKATQLFGLAEREVAIYRSRLLHPVGGDLRFFHVDDMPQEVRKKYGDMTDRQYFEFWEGTGSDAYLKSQPLLNSLWNKYRKSLLSHGVPAEEQSAWAITAMTCLQLAVEIWDHSMQSVGEAVDHKLTDDFICDVYRPFSLRRVADLWQQAIVALTPETATYKLDDADERNIELGIRQLREMWASPDLSFNATMQAVEDYDELFRTQGERKKALRELAEMRDEAVEDVRKLKRQRKRKDE